VNVNVPAAAWHKMCEKITELALPLAGLEVIIGSDHLTLVDEQGAVYGAVRI
jgi:hypothetical protein